MHLFCQELKTALVGGSPLLHFYLDVDSGGEV